MRSSVRALRSPISKIAGAIKELSWSFNLVSTALVVGGLAASVSGGLVVFTTGMNAVYFNAVDEEPGLSVWDRMLLFGSLFGFYSIFQEFTSGVNDFATMVTLAFVAGVAMSVIRPSMELDKETVTVGLTYGASSAVAAVGFLIVPDRYKLLVITPAITLSMALMWPELRRLVRRR